jgi:hypothetical protein
MARRSPNSPNPDDLNLFSEAKEPALVSTQFWAQLVKYRPLLLLGVLWFSLICATTLAYSRLMSTGVPIDAVAETPSKAALSSAASPNQPTVTPPSESASPDPTTAPLPAIDTSTSADEGATPRPEATVADDEFSWATVGGLLGMVSVCALGSWVIARQAKAPPRPAKPRRKRVVKQVRKLPPETGDIVGIKRLDPYSPERDNVVVPGATPALATALFDEALPETAVHYGRGETDAEPPMAATNPATPDYWEGQPVASASHSAAQPPLRSSRSAAPILPPQLSKPQPATRAEEPPAELHEPTVVPDSEDHPLDWPDASIAHTLDLRQQRSLSSLM